MTRGTDTRVAARPTAPATHRAPAAGGPRAVLLATAAEAGGGVAAALPWDGGTLLERLLEQLASLGVRDVTVVTRPAFEPALAGCGARLVVSESVADDLRAVADEAQHAPDGLVVGLADLVTHREALAGLLADPRLATAVLTGELEPDSVFPTRSRRGRIVSASSSYHSVHDPNQCFLSVLKVAPADIELVGEVAGRLRELPLGDSDDVTSMLLVGLVRGGANVGNSFLRQLYWARPQSADDVERSRAEIEHYDEDKALLDSAVKGADGFFTTFFVSPYSKYIARWAARRGLTPNQVTVASLVIGALAATAFATGERWGLITGAVLLQIAFTTDCVDGQLARYTRTFSKLGAWLDSVFDRTKEYLVFAGLAIGASRQGDPVWLLAGAALTLQVTRHTMEFSWAASLHQRIGTAEHPPLDQPRDVAGQRAHERAEARALRSEQLEAPPTSSPARRLLRTVVGRWTDLDRHPNALWVKRIISFPIGERFAAISITAALFSPRVTFIVLLAWGGFAGLYSATGRLLRSLAQ